MSNKTKIIAVAGKGGVGKTSLAGVIVKLLVESFPDKKILAIDADPAVGLSTVLNVDVDKTIDDIRKEVIKNVEDGDTKSAVELLGEAKYEIYDALKEQDGYAFIAIGRPESAGCYCRINSYLKEGSAILRHAAAFVFIFLYILSKLPLKIRHETTINAVCFISHILKCVLKFFTLLT